MPRRALLLIVLLAAFYANAQTSYRWIDKATNQTVYSDQWPPPDAKDAVEQAEKPVTPAADEDADWSYLPYSIKRVAGHFPVTLYTLKTCAAFCNLARDLLASRRVPYTEIVIDELPEVEQQSVLRQLGKEDVPLPALQVGPENRLGIDQDAWHALLDLAGFPQDVLWIAPPPPRRVPAKKAPPDAAQPSPPTGVPGQ